MSQTSMPIGGVNTNCVIAGHRGYNGSAFFQYIDRMKFGSKVYLTNPWETLVYQVTDVKIVSPNSSDEVLIQKNKDMLTLVSCHPYVIGGGPERYLVFCERVLEEADVADESEIQVDTSAEIRTDVDNSEIGVTQETDSTYKMDESLSDSVSQENELQKWERGLRVLVPLFVVFVGCVLLFIQCSRKK